MAGAWAFVHLSAIAALCAFDLSSLVRQGLTLLPFHSAATAETGAPLFDRPLWVLPSTYLRLSGIDAPYSFFAPNVPERYHLVVEYHFPDGRVEYEAPFARAGDAEVRTASLTDQVAASSSKELREGMLRVLTQAAWQRHLECRRVRGHFVRSNSPTLAQWRSGIRNRDEILYSCELSRPEAP